MRLALAAFLCAMACSDALAATACAEGGLRVADHASVAFEGDSLTYGFDPTPTGGAAPINGTPLGRSKLPFPEEVGRKLDGQIVVVNRGFPGDRSQDGLARWKGAKTTPVTVVMFGTNDFGNFGKLPGGPASPDRFAANLEKLIARRLDDGGRVVVATPPPLQNPESDQRLEAYRGVVRDLAHRHELPLIDTPRALDAVEGKWVDGLHLSTAANDALARAVASVLCVAAE